MDRIGCGKMYRNIVEEKGRKKRPPNILAKLEENPITDSYSDSAMRKFLLRTRWFLRELD